MNLKRRLLVFVLSLFVSLLAACQLAADQEPVTPVVKVITTVATVEVTATPLPEIELVEICTLLGCDDSLTIDLEAELSGDFIVQVTDAEGETEIIHCFEHNPETRYPFSYTSKSKREYARDDPVVAQLATFSEAVNLCPPGSSGYVRVYTWDDLSPNHLAVYCSGPPPGLFVATGCSTYIGGSQKDIKYARFSGFTPSEAQITVYWASDKKSVSVHPDYRVFSPNGPDCPPTCRQGWVTISLP